MTFQPDEIIKTCSRIESGLRLGPDGIRACCFSVIVAPLYWDAEQAAHTNIDRQMIIEKRRKLLDALNDDHSDISCKKCLKVEEKRYSDIRLDQLGFIDLAHFSTCNMRCSYCGFTQNDSFHKAKYNALNILRQFPSDSVEWDSCVDFNGGEPTLLPDLGSYIDFFRKNAIRTRLYSNGLRFRQEIIDGLMDGAIAWLIVSLDAGTPSTFYRIKKSQKYLKVVENLARYADAGSRGKGDLAVKYIFCEENCSDDDVAGFAYTMLAIRPQKIYLGFDFSPIIQFKTAPSGDPPNFSRQIEAYAKTYILLKKHGLEAVHFYESFLATVDQEGRELISASLAKIAELEPSGSVVDPALHLPDSRNGNLLSSPPLRSFAPHPLRLLNDFGSVLPWSLEKKRVAIAPASPEALALLADPSIASADLVGFMDRSTAKQGKVIAGHRVHAYDAVTELQPDIVLIASPFHAKDIVQSILKHSMRPIDFAQISNESV